MLENSHQIDIQTRGYDGPLGLLLHLIQKDEMKIEELDITSITRQYLDYITKMQEMNFDVAGDFLFMAATLVYLKSQNCVTLPLDNQGEEGAEFITGITSTNELIRRLEELEHYQRLALKIGALPRRGQDIFVKPKVDRKIIANSILTPIDLQQLIMSMVEFYQRERRKYALVKRDRLSIKEKLVNLKSLLKIGQKKVFSELISIENNLDDLVITFISLLELARLKKVDVFQGEDRGPIYVEVLESLDDFDVNMADGFGEEDEANAVAAPLEAETEDAFIEVKQSADEIDTDTDEKEPTLH